MAGGMAFGTVAEGARRWLNGDEVSASDLVLNGANAKQLAKSLARMRGAAMKLGQLLSLEGDVNLPPEFADALSGLRSSADMMPPSQLHGVLGREYGHGWAERFDHFGEVPVASASIGQVHRAVTRDGRELALKIQFPGVAKSIGSDVDNLGTLLKVLRVVPEGVDLGPILREVKRQLRRETDYLREAEGLRRYRGLLGDESAFRIPEVHDDFTTKHILAMDYIDARPLSELWEKRHAQRLRDRVGEALQGLAFRELFEFGFMQSDPNSGNFLFSPKDGRLVLLDFGATIELRKKLVADYARLCRAAVDEDRETIHHVALGFGMLTEDDREDRVEGFVDLVIMCCEPLRARGRYDYGKTDLADRAREASLDLAFGRGLLRPPPPQALFIHRKLGGTFSLCKRLGARISTRALIDPYL